MKKAPPCFLRISKFELLCIIVAKKLGFFKHGNIPFYWVKVGPISGKTWDKSLGSRDVISCAKHSRSSQQTAERLRISKGFHNTTEETTGNFTTTIMSDCEDFFARPASPVELFALIGTAPSMSPLLTVSPFESWPARSSEMHGTQCRCLRRTEPLRKACPLPTQTLFQGKTVHRYTRSQDCVGATITNFFFPPYLHAQLMTSLHLSHILGQTPPTLEPVYRRLASNSRPLFV